MAVKYIDAEVVAIVTALFSVVLYEFLLYLHTIPGMEHLPRVQLS